MKKLKLLFILYSAILLTTCKSNDKYFTIKNGDSAVPIEIDGNLDSEVFVVLIGQEVFSDEPFQNLSDELKKNYAVVYYPFYKMGNLSLNCFVVTCSLLELSGDLDVLIRVLSEKYSKPIFLYGNGLGANLALLYADIGVNKDKVNGLLLSGTTHNLRTTMEFSQTKLIELLENEIAFSNDIGGGLSSFLNELSAFDINTSSFERYYALMYNSSDIFEWTHLNISCNYGDIIVAYNMHNARNQDEDITEHISNIELPVNLLWQKDEFLIPLSVGEEVYDILETPNKELHIFEDVCLPFSEDEDKIKEYAQPIIEFIDKYK